MLNVVAIMGRLTRDPELKTAKAGLSVCRFSIACDRSFVRQGEERKADFFDIVAWRQTAELICKYFQKGSQIAIDGRLQTESYQDKQGNNRTRIEIVANNVSFASSGKRPAQPVDDGGEAPPPDYRGTAPAYAQGSADDFAVIDDTDDIPF